MGQHTVMKKKKMKLNLLRTTVAVMLFLPTVMGRLTPFGWFKEGGRFRQGGDGFDYLFSTKPQQETPPPRTNCEQTQRVRWVAMEQDYYKLKEAIAGPGSTPH